MKIKLILASKLNKEQIKQCSGLRLKYGMMWGNFTDCQNKKTCYVALAQNNKNIVGWGLLFNDYEYSYEPSIQLFICPKYRRQKIGSRILNKLINTSKRMRKRKPSVMPWNKASEDFFSKVKNTSRKRYY